MSEIINPKYLIASLPDKTATKTICQLMDAAAEISGQEPLYQRLPPHITLHRPITNVDEEKLLEVLQNLLKEIPIIKTSTSTRCFLVKSCLCCLLSYSH